MEDVQFFMKNLACGRGYVISLSSLLFRRFLLVLVKLMGNTMETPGFYIW